MGCSRHGFRFATCLSLVTTSVVSAGTPKTIALTGQPAGQSSQTFYTQIDIPTINKNGAVLFRAALSDLGTPAASDGLFTNAGGPTRLIARTGTAAPGFAGANYWNFSNRPLVSAIGHVSFVAGVNLTPPTTTLASGLYSGSPDAPILTRRDNDAVQNAPSATSAGPGYLGGLNDFDQSVVTTSLLSAGNPALQAIAVYSPSATERIVARQGDLVPSVSPTATIDGTMSATAITNAGAVTFSGQIRTDYAMPPSNAVFFAAAGETPRVLARYGAPAPMAGPGVTYANAGTVVNNAGQVLVNASLVGAEPNSSAGNALYLHESTSMRLLAITGGVAPGMPAGMTYQTVSSPAINDAGQIAYLGFLDGPIEGDPTTTALYFGDPDAPRPIVTTNDRVTDAAGARPRLRFNDRPSLNERSQLAFMASLIGPGVTGDNDRALLAYDPIAGLQVIARESKPFDLGNGMVKTIATVGYEDRIQLAGLANDGTIVFRLTFTDNTVGIFSAVVPEPTTLSSLAFASLMLRRQTRWHR